MTCLHNEKRLHIDSKRYEKENGRTRMQQTNSIRLHIYNFRIKPNPLPVCGCKSLKWCRIMVIVDKLKGPFPRPIYLYKNLEVKRQLLLFWVSNLPDRLQCVSNSFCLRLEVRGTKVSPYKKDDGVKQWLYIKKKGKSLVRPPIRVTEYGK